MLNFKQYILESIDSMIQESLVSDTEKIKHVSHIEDLGHEYGHAGAEHAINALEAASSHIEHGKHNSSFTYKIDGGISIIAGKHPINGKHFVAYKTALDKIGTNDENKSKLCYSHHDIDKYYSDKPYVTEPLHYALDHAHKVLPRKGLYQGDVLFTEKSKKHEGDRIWFEPNTIKYSAKTSSAEGRKIKTARFGAAWHISYEMKNGKLIASPIDHSQLKSHDDSYNLSTSNDTSRAHYSDSEKAKFQGHLNSAKEIHNKTDGAMYNRITHIGNHIARYINHTVKTGEVPSINGIKRFIKEKSKKEIDSVKTEKAKQLKRANIESIQKYIDNNKEHFDNYLKLHNHLQKAKNILVNTLNNSDHPLEHTIADKKSHPEGYIFHHNNIPVKFINRAEFSKANFEKSRD